MNSLFEERRKVYYRQNLKYLRYVFNDHFVLFLMILLGALAVQYAQFLQVHSLSVAEKVGLVLLVSALSQAFGRLATFVEPADKVFLLPQEVAVRKVLWMSCLRSLIFPAAISFILVGVVAPLLRWSLLYLVLWFLLLVLLKALGLTFRLRQMMPSGIIAWESLIAYEENRKTNTLRFFALFTNVKGLKTQSRRRKYLDFLLPKTLRTYEYLFSRSFLRSGDYLSLTLRLVLLAVLSLIFIDNSIVAVILAAVFNYLLLFQLFALQESFDYQLLTRIYPLRQSSKFSALTSVLSRVMLAATAVELVFGLIFLEARLYLALVLLVNFFLVKFYIKYRLKVK